MNNAIMIRVHQELLQLQREQLIEEIRVFEGVTYAHFSHNLNDWLNVVYDPKSISAKIILNRVKQWDKNAAIF